MKSKIAALLFTLVLSGSGSAQQYVIKNFVSDREICLETLGKPFVQKDTLVAIVSHETHDLLGYATISGATDDEECPSQAMVKAHIAGVLMRPGNLVYIMDVTQADTSIPGSFSLLVHNDEEASVRFKPMVYLGPTLGQTAATLAPREIILGFGIAGVAPREGIQFDTTTYLNFLGTPNVGLKTRIWRNEELSLSLYGKSYYYALKSKAVFDFEVILDNYSSSRTASHTKVTVKGQRPTRGIFDQEKGKKSITTRVENFYSIMLPRWDRIMVGPRFNVTDNILGAYLGYAIMWDSAHIVIGGLLDNVVKPDIVSSNVDFFWRF